MIMIMICSVCIFPPLEITGHSNQSETRRLPKDKDKLLDSMEHEIFVGAYDGK